MAKAKSAAPKKKAKAKSAASAGTVRMKIKASPDSTIGVPVGNRVVHIKVDGKQMANVPRECVPVLGRDRLGEVVEEKK